MASVAPDPWLAPTASPPSPLQRPGGVTFACVLSMVLGALGIVAGFAIFLASAAFSLIPIVGPFFAIFGVMIAVISIAMGGFGVVAGSQAMQGVSWARWALVVLLAVGGVFSIQSIVIPVLNIAGIIMLMNRDASEWFAAVGR